MNNTDLLLSQIQRGLNGYQKIIEKIGTQKSYDIIIAHETFCSGIAALYYSRHLINEPLKILDIVEYPIFSQRSTNSIREKGLENPFSDSFTYDLAINIANKFDHCFATSNGQAQAYIRNGYVNKIDILMNCREINLNKISTSDTLREKYNFDRSDIILVYPNRAYENCGLEISLQALAKLDSRYKLIVLGDVVNELSDKVQDLVNSLKLTDRFFINGMVDPSLLLQHLADADVALILLEPIIQNHKYSMPNRLFDALSTNTPMIAFSDTETGDFIAQQKIGVICKSQSPDDLAAAIIESIEKNIYYKKQLAEINIKYTWENQTNIFFDIIKKIQQSNKRVLFIALKDITRNDRVKRLTRSLNGIGFDIDVITYKRPLDSMIVNNVKYYCLDDSI
jgi:glycosyltransferase involved in cell wall biosynthesis